MRISASPVQLALVGPNSGAVCEALRHLEQTHCNLAESIHQLPFRDINEAFVAFSLHYSRDRLEVHNGHAVETWCRWRWHQNFQSGPCSRLALLALHFAKKPYNHSTRAALRKLVAETPHLSPAELDEWLGVLEWLVREGCARAQTPREAADFGLAPDIARMVGALERSRDGAAPSLHNRRRIRSLATKVIHDWVRSLDDTWKERALLAMARRTRALPREEAGPWLQVLRMMVGSTNRDICHRVLNLTMHGSGGCGHPSLRQQPQHHQDDDSQVPKCAGSEGKKTARSVKKPIAIGRQVNMILSSDVPRRLMELEHDNEPALIKLDLGSGAGQLG